MRKLISILFATVLVLCTAMSAHARKYSFGIPSDPDRFVIDVPSGVKVESTRTGYELTMHGHEWPMLEFYAVKNNGLSLDGLADLYTQQLNLNVIDSTYKQNNVYLLRGQQPAVGGVAITFTRMPDDGTIVVMGMHGIRGDIPEQLIYILNHISLK